AGWRSILHNHTRRTTMKKQTLIMILGLAGFTVMADNWVVSPILPAIAGDLGQEVTRAGLLITAYMLPFGLFQLVFGPLADRYGKRQVLAGTMLFSRQPRLFAPPRSVSPI
ncbi:MAG: MFS transporter, partial [Chloroflexota bacterium]